MISVAPGEILTVTADAGGYGTVWQEGTSRQWTVGARSPLNLGAGLYRIETVKGTVRGVVSSQALAALSATLPRATDIIHSAAVVAAAINEGRSMSSMQEKFKRLAERANAVPKALSDRADVAFTRLDTVEKRGETAFGGLESVLTDVESGITAAEDAVSQLTNGAPVA